MFVSSNIFDFLNNAVTKIGLHVYRISHKGIASARLPRPHAKCPLSHVN